MKKWFSGRSKPMLMRLALTEGDAAVTTYTAAWQGESAAIRRDARIIRGVRLGLAAMVIVIVAACVLALTGCADRSGERYPLDRMIDPVTEQTPTPREP